MKTIICDYCKKDLKNISNFYILHIWDNHYSTKCGSKKLFRYDICKDCLNKITPKEQGEKSYS